MAYTTVTEDYYALLGVSPFAATSTIRDAYKKLALRHHPDKNPSADTTAAFQKLVIAWETLSDASKRADYDQELLTDFGSSRSWSFQDDEEVVRENAEKARRRKEDIDRESTGRFHGSATGNASPFTSAKGEKKDPFERAAFLAMVREWKKDARNLYASRLQIWTSFQRGHDSQILEAQSRARQFNLQLLAQTGVPDAIIIQKFQEAISRRTDKNQDPNLILAQLLAAREKYIANLHRCIGDEEMRIDQLRRDLGTARRQYEESEADARDELISQALGFLGPRDLNAPLFSVLDRRGRVINYWKALNGVRSGTIFDSGRPPSQEGPWHLSGEWERSAGEYSCGRCAQGAFHIIAECGSAKCPGCGMVVCNNCHRDLNWLREYEAWILEEGELGGGSSMFDLEFEEVEEVNDSARDYGNGFGMHSQL